MSSDLTPPPMSEDAIYALYESRDRFGIAWAAYCIGAEEALAARDEQWRQRLEQVGTTDMDGNLLTLKALPDGTPLYRIKEQG